MEDVPILDLERLTLISRGNAAIASEFLGALIDEATELLDRFSALLGGNDGAAAGDIVHTLKGIANELGAQRLRAAATALEAETEPGRWAEHLGLATAALGELRLLHATP